MYPNLRKGENYEQYLERRRHENRLYREKHAEEVKKQNREAAKRHRENNPESAQKAKRKYRSTMPDEIRQRENERSQQYRQSHKEAVNKAKNGYNKRVRAIVLEHYGNKCTCCGETKPEFLCMDHINGGGSQHRKEIKRNIYYWLRSQDYPPEFRILCHNCNLSLGFYGYCPHSTCT